MITVSLNPAFIIFSNYMPLKRPLFDIAINVFAPLLFGYMVYISPVQLPRFITDYMADAMWAYAFTSLILIIWQREKQSTWLFASVLTGIIYEACQFWHLLPGVADLFDLLTYFIFFALALRTNNFFKQKFTLPYENN
jgi:hypothetical protein